MLNREEDQFEARLKEFRPLRAEPLPVERVVPARRRRFVLAACAVAAIVLAAVALTMHRERPIVPAPQRNVKQTAAEAPANGRPLTIRTANELLASAPSVKSALDELAFHSRRKQLPHGTQSALAVLGEEDFKP
jgi:hypothetical protein